MAEQARPRLGSPGEETALSPFLLVGIGASAGGLEAIEAFFANMTPHSGLAFVVVQHLSPDYKSLMVELLSKRTEMPVYRAEEGMEVERNSVYLIPPKQNLTIFHGKLQLREQEPSSGLNLPIDIFLRSLAEDQGEKAVGVILSGTGSDGMRGVRAIKESGGMVMVQDEESARFNGMPRSAISTGLADFILAPEEMPAQLLSFAQHPYVSRGDPQPLLSDESGLDRIFSLLRQRCKVDFTYYKPTTVTRRIERRMSVNQINDLGDYVHFLESYPTEVNNLYRELLIGVTSFFRDTKAFDLLLEEWLPRLLERRQNEEIRLWVAGCSTGEEAYTLAILCRECMARLDQRLDVKIFATDLDNNAILQASNGLYPESIAADLPRNYLAAYFQRKQESFQVVRSLREMVVFAQHNLLKDPPFTNIELISCRNLLIYLQPVLQHKALEFFNFSLNDGGILLLGSSETVGDYSDRFEMLHHKWKLYRSRGRRQLPGVSTPAPPTTARGLGSRARVGRNQRFLRSYEEERLLDRFLQGTSGDYLPTTLLVNEQLELLHLIGDATDLLQLPSGRMQNDITRMASKELSIPLATGLQKVFGKGEELKYSNIRLTRGDVTHKLQMRIRLLPQKKGQEPLAAVFLEREEVETTSHDETAQTFDIGKEAEERILELEQELQFSRENLQATIEELETSNEELQATNEELLASNEELQSTNEELQSVNEELHTVNAEHQLKIMELTELNNDLDNLLASAQIATLFLDENLEVRKFTEPLRQIFQLNVSDLGRPFEHLRHNVTGVDLSEWVRQVQQTSQPLSREVHLPKQDGWFLLKILPYRIGPQTVSGVVLTFVDITPIKEAHQELSQRESQMREMARMARIGRWEFVLETKEHSWSEEVFHIHELPLNRQPSPEEGISYYTPESQKTIQRLFAAACDEGTPYEEVLQIITAKGNRRWVRAQGNPVFEEEQVVRVTGTFQDVTELVLAEKAREESEQRYRELFDHLQSGVAVYEAINEGQDFLLCDLNRAGEVICEIEREEVLGQPVTQVFPGIESIGLLQALRKTWHSKEKIHVPTVHYDDGRLSAYVENDIYCLPSGEVVAVFSDYSRQRTLEQRLEKMEALLQKQKQSNPQQEESPPSTATAREEET